MPSVAVLCDEMALQRRYKYEHKESSSTLAHQDLALGILDKQAAMVREQVNVEEINEVDEAQTNYLITLLTVKVFLGNVAQLWIQTSFFALTFRSTHEEAKLKVVIGMAIGALRAMVNTCRVMQRAAGMRGLDFVMGVILFVLICIVSMFIFLVV